MDIKRIVSYIVALPKSLYFNFKYFDFKTAIRLPVLISNKVYLLQTKGNITLENPTTFGVKVGFGNVGIFDQKKSRTIWQVDGKVVFKGKANIGHGSKISVSADGYLELGSNFSISAESTVVCNREIIIGDSFLSSWENLIMDTDFHKIMKDERVTNADLPIRIGNNVWLGCRSTILKGTIIPDNTVVAACSIIYKEFQDTHTIIGGNPVRQLKTGIDWMA